ncbi:MAG TPA: TetR/AcrR family transcriptional regulator, partial [Solirubrobacteraceae bacterium]|nr:TetR/AcrR family transcriptional regulator [Solirubrobacteraceae bacterium]
MARIRELSGVSNGTLFHYFPSKEAIADALYLEAIADFQEGLWRLLAERPRSLRTAVRGVIAHQIEWIEANIDRARFVYTRGTLDGDSPGGAELDEMNRKLATSYEEWL